MSTPHATGWASLGNLRGPKGDQGDAGADGGTSPHAPRHAVGGSDPVTPAAIGAAADADVVHASGAETIAGLKTFVNGVATAQPSAANMAVRHDDARLSDARPPTAHGHAGADITSGTVAYARLPVGTTASTVAAGNDTRLSDARTPTAHTHPEYSPTTHTHSGYAATSHTHAEYAAANHTHTPGSIGAAPASHTHAAGDITRTILSQTSVGTGGTITPSAAADIDRFTSTGSSATLAVPSGTPADGAVVNVEVYSTGSTTALTLASGYTLTGGQGSPVPVPAGRVVHLALRYRALTPAGWRILAVSVDN